MGRCRLTPYFSGFLVVPFYGKEPTINHSTLSRVSATVVLFLSSAAVSITLGTTAPEASGSTVNCHAVPHEGVDFAGCNFNGRDLGGADLRDANLRGTNFHDANLKDAQLSGANLFRTDLEGAQMSGANLNDVISGSLKGIPILPADWNLVSGYLVGPNADLKNAQFSGANLFDSDLLNAQMSGANLTSVTSGSVTGTPVLPIGWKLIDGYLIGPGAYLNNAMLAGARLSHVDLAGANLIRAQLSNASLIGANLSGATLNGADLSAADLSGANLLGAIVIGATTTNALTNGATVCPGGELGPCNASWLFLKGAPA